MSKTFRFVPGALLAFLCTAAFAQSPILPAFANTPVGSTSTQTVTITVPAGGSAIATAQIASGFPEFSLGSNTCAGTAPGSTCTATVTFQPKLPGVRTAPLVLTDGAGNEDYFGLEGIGESPEVALAPGVTEVAAGVYNGERGGYSGDGGAATAAAMDLPIGIAVDSSFNLYVADYNNHAIRRVDAGTGEISTLVSSVGVGDLAVDAAGDVYFDSDANNAVAKLTPDGMLSVFAGTTSPGYAGDGGPATAAELDQPEGIAVGAAGDVFVADTMNNVIREINTTTGVISTVAGNGTFGFSGDGGAATKAELKHPYGVAVDASGNIYIADSGNERIRRVDAKTGVITTIAGGGSVCAGAVDYIGDGCPATSATLSLIGDSVNSNPIGATEGIAVDAAGDVFVDSEYGVVRRIDAATQIITVAAGNLAGVGLPYSGIGGPANMVVWDGAAEGIAVDGAGNLYIADASDDVILATGTGVGGVISFGDQTAGQSSAPRSFNLTNIGNESLSLASVTASTDFAVPTPVSGDCKAGSIAVGGSCSVQVEFAPFHSGALTGTLTLTDDALNGSPATQVVNLSGTGTQGGQTITFTGPTALTYGKATDLSTDASATSGLPVTFKLTSGPATLSGTTLTPTGIGSVTVEADQAGNDAFTAATPITQTFLVGPASLTVTGADASMVYGGALPTFSASISGFVNSDTDSVVSGAAALTTTATSRSSVGKYPITPAVGTLKAANYTFDTFTPGTLTIAKAPLTVAAADASMSYGSKPPTTFTPSFTGFVNGDTAAVVSGTASFSTTATSTSPVGTYPITASVGSLTAANYTITPSSTPGTLTITPASQTITFAAIPGHVVGDAPFALQATASSGLPVTFSIVSGPASLSGGTLTVTGVGTVVVEADQAGDKNHSAAPAVRQSFAVTAAPTISLGASPGSLDFGSQVYNTKSGAQTVTLTNTGQATVTFSSIAVTGADQADFAETTACGSSLASGKSCTVSIVFTPGAAGERTASLSIADNAPDSPQSVALKGTGSDLAISAASGGSTSATVSAGQTANFALSLTPLESLSGTFALSCSGAPANATCSVDPASVDLTAGTPAAVTVKVTTASAASELAPIELAPPSKGPGLPGGWLLLLAGSALGFGLLLLGPRRRRSLRRGLAGAAAFGALSLMVACGGGGNAGGGSAPPPAVNPSTPSGSYNLTVQAKDASGDVAGSTTLKLTVQ